MGGLPDVTPANSRRPFAFIYDGTSDFAAFLNYLKNVSASAPFGALGVFLLLASRNPSAHRSLIAFTAWSSFAHATVMVVQAYLSFIARRELFGVATFVVIGITLIALSPAQQAREVASTATA